MSTMEYLYKILMIYDDDDDDELLNISSAEKTYFCANHDIHNLDGFSHNNN